MPVTTSATPCKNRGTLIGRKGGRAVRGWIRQQPPRRENGCGERKSWKDHYQELATQVEKRTGRPKQLSEGRISEKYDIRSLEKRNRSKKRRVRIRNGYRTCRCRVGEEKTPQDGKSKQSHAEAFFAGNKKKRATANRAGR